MNHVTQTHDESAMLDVWYTLHDKNMAIWLLVSNFTSGSAIDGGLCWFRWVLKDFSSSVESIGIGMDTKDSESLKTSNAAKHLFYLHPPAYPEGVMCSASSFVTLFNFSWEDRKNEQRWRTMLLGSSSLEPETVRVAATEFEITLEKAKFSELISSPTEDWTESTETTWNSKLSSKGRRIHETLRRRKNGW